MQEWSICQTYPWISPHFSQEELGYFQQVIKGLLDNTDHLDRGRGEHWEQ